MKKYINNKIDLFNKIFKSIWKCIDYVKINKKRLILNLNFLNPLKF